MRAHAFIPSLAVAWSLGVGHPAPAQVVEPHNLASDDGKVVPANASDHKLINAWGVPAGPTTLWWVLGNGTRTATLYDGTGTKQALEVVVPGDPTGVVFNGGTGFSVSDGAGHSGAALFIFASEGGRISGWNPDVPPAPPTPSTQAFTAVGPSPDNGYTGLAIAGNLLYATNFRAGKVDVFDSNWVAVHMPGAFTDPGLPAGYAPVGIANLNGTIFVTYALPDGDKHDVVAGEGHGFVDAFDTNGHLLRRIEGPAAVPVGPSARAR